MQKAKCCQMDYCDAPAKQQVYDRSGVTGLSQTCTPFCNNLEIVKNFQRQFKPKILTLESRPKKPK